MQDLIKEEKLMLDLISIKKRCEAATPGPWVWCYTKYRDGYTGIIGKDNSEVLFPNHCNDGDDGDAWFEDLPSEEDRDFIAHAREDIPALIAEVESLQAQLAESRERERAAVHDIELVLNGAGVCHVCANGDCKDGEHCEPKWRGPAGEGAENGK
jgi:hypothetical protein